MANDAYKILTDTSFSFPLRTAVTTEDVVIEETTGRAYAAGDYIYPEEMTQRDQERAENGELDHLLESVSRDEADQARAARVGGLFIPEHEVERYALLDAGHRVIEKDQVLDLRSAGAQAAKDYLEASRKGPNDANPLITEQPSFVEVSDITASQNAGEPVLPGAGKQDAVSDYEIVNAPSGSDAGVEMPPGLPVGPTLAKAEGADPEKVDAEVEKSVKKAARQKPGTSGSSGSSDK